MQHDKIAFTLREAAAASGLSRTTIYKLISADGGLPSVKVAGRRLILRDDLDAFFKSMRESAPA